MANVPNKGRNKEIFVGEHLKLKHFTFNLTNSNIGMQYNTYINNKTKGVSQLYVRLRGDKLHESENSSRLFDETSVDVSLSNKESASVGGKKDASVSAKTSVGVDYSKKNEQEQKTRRVFSSLVQGSWHISLI